MSLGGVGHVEIIEGFFGLIDVEIDMNDIHCDNKSCIKLIENLVFHDKSKHIEIRYDYILDCYSGFHHSR